MEFPTFVCRCPGTHFGPMGTTYSILDVHSSSDLSAALEAGWYLTVHEAVQAHLGIAKAASAPINDDKEDDSPPTRNEMLAQAQRIGLKIDRRWNDETLLEHISRRMKEKEAGK